MREFVLSLTEHSSQESVFSLATDWHALIGRAPRATAFQTPAWILSGLRHLAPPHLRVLALREGGDLVGLAPFFCWRNGQVRTLSLLLPGISDHLDVVSADGFEGAVADGVADWLDASRGNWDACQFDEVAGHAVLRRLPSLPGVCSRWSRQSVCPMRASDSAVPVAQARKLRRDRSRAERWGTVSFHRADRNGSTAREALWSLFDLHERRWQGRGESGVLAKPDVRAFHVAAADAFRTASALRLYVLRLGERMAGVIYGFRVRDTLSLYLQGIEPAVERASPGTILLGATLQDALEEGVRTVDFLRGDEPYKYSWGALDAPSDRLRLEAVRRSDSSSDAPRGPQTEDR